MCQTHATPLAVVVLLYSGVQSLCSCIQVYSAKQLKDMSRCVMEHWDLDHDGRIDLKELSMLLLQQHKTFVSQMKTPKKSC